MRFEGGDLAGADPAAADPLVAAESNMAGPQEVRGARSALSDWAALVTSQGGSALVAAVTVILTTQLLGSEGFGRLNLLLIAPMLVSDLGSAWTGAAVLSLGREEFERHSVLGLTTWARAAIVVPVVIVVSSLVVIAAALGAYEGFTATAIALALLMGPARIVPEHMAQLLQAAGRMKASAVAQVLNRTFLLVLLVILVLGTSSASVDTVLLAYLGGAAIGAVAVTLMIGRVGFSPLRLDAEYARRMLRYSLPLVLAVACTFGIRWCDILIINLYGSYEDVGVYGLAYQGYMTLFPLTSITVAVAVPLVVSAKLAGRMSVVRTYYSRVVPQAVAVAAVALGLAAAPVHALVPVIFGDEFAGASEPFVLLLLALLYAAAFSLVAAVLMGLERTRWIALAAAAAVGVNVALDFVLIPAVGIVGAAIASTVANLAMTVILDLRVRRELSSRAAWLWPTAPLMVAIAVVLAFDGGAGYVLAPVAALLTAAVIARRTSLFVPADAAIVDGLALPGIVKRGLARLVALAAPAPDR